MATAYAPTAEVAPILIEREQPDFVQTPYVKDMVKRALLYIRAGFPLHIRGPAGTGKTTLAMYVAGQLGQPVILMHGDEEFGTSDLVGGEYGYRVKKTVDNFIHSVLKTEEDVQRRWVDSRVTVACKYGFTLLYDEFTRSRPEANNVLLSVLGEKILDLPATHGGEEGQLRVHPDFSAIVTSNPEEYAGIHKAQDALRDRMVTINLGYYDRETEIAITQAKSGIGRPDAERVVDIVRDFRQTGEYEFTPTVRACIMIGKVMSLSGVHALMGDDNFTQTCLDVLGAEAAGGESKVRQGVLDLMGKHCGRRNESRV
ncbi:MAG: gas vesicle protein GvpN [Dehalococcoidia bacterium]